MSRIEKALVFEFRDWIKDREAIINRVKESFRGDKIIVRSSALNENTTNSSMAGAYRSYLNVSSSSSEQICSAVENVLNSYRERGGARKNDEVLIQAQTLDVKSSGVVLTKSASDLAPYYIISFDDLSGSTEKVTSGAPCQSFEIFRGAPEKLIPTKWNDLFYAVKEIENIVADTALDIEFAIRSEGTVILHQVRPIVNPGVPTEVGQEVIEERLVSLKDKFDTHSKPVSGLIGRDSIFSDMAFWNPSEIIGDFPNPLDYSLYRHLITDKEWQIGLVSMGYQKISSSRLMVEFGGKPYIDMRCVFNALCLDSFPETLKHKLVAFYMDKLETFPQLHDEVEFSVLFSAYDFDFDERAEELRGILNYHEIRLLKECLLEFTENIIENYSQWLTDDSADMLYFDKARTELSAVDCSSIQVKACFLDHLLSSIKKYGTGQFSRAARLAFIAKSLLKSLERKEFLTAEQYNAILRSIGTVTSDFTHDISRYAKGEISIAELRRLYGHLRPGSYNILNERYDISPVYLTGFEQNMREGELRFSLPFETRNRIDGYLEEEGIKMRCESILQFVVDATQARERFKFEFTKFLSDALEVIAVIGRDLGLSKHEVALLDIETLLSLKNESESKESGARKIRALISDRIWERTRDKLLRLPPLLKNRLDFEFFYHMDSKPNFITHKSVVGDAIYLEDGVLDLSDKIVLIEFADPGFDWIFTRQIRGLITKYGGPASHMGIRCAELGIPAALGCGRLFDKLRHQKKLSLDCRTEALFSMQCF